jgi:hypothetical protein
MGTKLRLGSRAMHPTQRRSHNYRPAVRFAFDPYHRPLKAPVSRRGGAVRLERDDRRRVRRLGRYSLIGSTSPALPQQRPGPVQSDRSFAGSDWRPLRLR